MCPQVARTRTNIILGWSLPNHWGGCALSHFEVQMREQSMDGLHKDWEKPFEVTGAESSVSFYRSLYAGHARVAQRESNSHFPALAHRLLTEF
jgi:hypothetical protein